MKPKNRIAIHPGEILKKEFLEPMGLNQVDLARQMNEAVASSWPRFGWGVYNVVQGLSPVTAEMAVALALLFDTTPEFWMNLQTTYDLTMAREYLGMNK